MKLSRDNGGIMLFGPSSYRDDNPQAALTGLVGVPKTASAGVGLESRRFGSGISLHDKVS